MNVFGIVENMSGFTCPHCSETVDIFGSGGGEKTAIESGIPFLGKIPFDPKMVTCGDTGTSYVDENQDSGVSKAFSEIADKMGKLTVPSD